MKIERNAVVSISYTMTNLAETLLDSTAERGPHTYLHGYRNLIPGLEEALEGQEEGFTGTIRVSPEKGFGERHPEAIQGVLRSSFPEDIVLEPGSQIAGQNAEGEHIYTVIKVTNDVVLLDANHQYAGETLLFNVEVLNVREGTPDEILKGDVG
ncbi:MAG: peptidylprolyl isomerase [Gammaproteobacteria bacterium]|nr:peptidylprolyl isomerase [Gammaproteobacteria bacterium]